MGKPYSDDIRWLVVWKRLVRGKSPREVTEDLEGAVCADTQDIWLRCFAQTGDVAGRTGKAASEESSRRQMTPEMDLLLFQLVIDSPSAMLKEHHRTIVLSTGSSVDLSTICRAMRRLGMTRQRLQHYAYQRDENLAQQSWLEIMTFWNATDIVVLDETAKDLSVLRRSFGYAIRGHPATAPDVAPLRHARVSSLCAFTIEGFVDWRHTEGTFTRDTFLEAIYLMFLGPKSTGICARRPLVLIDNARIHHSDDFVNLITRAGGCVKFLAPYCWHLSPLDNGAFGMVVRWMQEHQRRLVQLPLHEQLDLAFTHAVDSAGARMCFRNCEYLR